MAADHIMRAPLTEGENPGVSSDIEKRVEVALCLGRET